MKELTEKQKLQAIDYKLYQYQKWEPKKGDYYTLTRYNDWAGLELFQIIEENETQFGITKIWDQNKGFQTQPTFFDKIGFTDQGFGINRIFIPEWIYLGWDEYKRIHKMRTT